ncbi:substrate-binding periplasmic protein [Zooshikella harenae]|uniref:Transporter substrate-binding domain-containing protein n=1 Tax=Zooshikella harenae TaxID=2827238 RepID=A0ABS5Z6S9_9GAMM|nr:transporter substrate-binding domain-containing protein [Zooshikella harenae]MBU2709762.1 transporter substrate-binding domain-containing protein [Zooshikella harenae]
MKDALVIGMPAHPIKRSQKSLLALFLLFFVALDFPASPASAAECKTLTASGNSEYPPLLWRDRENPKALLGLSVEVLSEALKSKQIKLKARYVGPWSRAQALAKSGDIDLLAGAFKTAERLQYMDYIEPPLLEVPSVLFVQHGQRFPFTTWEHLKNKHGATLINNSFGEKFDRFAAEHLQIYGVRSVKLAFNLLLAERTDYVLYELYPGLAYAREMAIEHKIEYLQKPVNAEGLYFTIAKRSPCNTPELKSFIRKTVIQFRQSGEQQNLLNKYLSLWQRQATLKPPPP